MFGFKSPKTIKAGINVLDQKLARHIADSVAKEAQYQAEAQTKRNDWIADRKHQQLIDQQERQATLIQRATDFTSAVPPTKEQQSSLEAYAKALEAL